MNLTVIGNPIEHSFSPRLFEVIDPSLQYSKTLIKDEKELDVFFQSIHQKNITGLNITSPFKQKVIPYLDEISLSAKSLNSVNTILIKNQKLWGYNTDIDGINFVFNQFFNKTKTVTIIGYGATSKNIISFLEKNNIQYQIVLRNPQKHLSEFNQNINSININDNLDQVLLNTDLLINTTPVGTFPQIDKSPISFSNDLNLTHLSFFDVIYNPQKTQLAKNLENCGVKYSVNGLPMLIQQGIKAYEIFTENVCPKKFDDIEKQLYKNDFLIN